LKERRVREAIKIVALEFILVLIYWPQKLGWLDYS
jgi:hypothetical protein